MRRLGWLIEILVLIEIEENEEAGRGHATGSRVVQHINRIHNMHRLFYYIYISAVYLLDFTMNIL